MYQFTTAHPSVQLDVVDRLEVGRGRVLFEVRVSSERPESWTEEIRRLPEVRDVELIDATERSSTYRVLFAGPTFIPLAKRLKLPRQFPFPVRDGVATWTVVGAEQKVRRMLQDLSASGVPMRVESIRRGALGEVSGNLTDRQRDVLRQAISEGYFDVPRRTSLTELAARVGVAPSTLSVTLAVIEKKIVESHPITHTLHRKVAPRAPLLPQRGTEEPPPGGSGARRSTSGPEKREPPRSARR